MRIFTAALVTETNTFSPIPTGRAAFALNRIDVEDPFPDFASLLLWRSLAATDGHDVVESVAAVAEPAGKTVRSVYEELRDRLLHDVRAAMPVDVILLYLHGAMVADGYDDCEGDVLERVRAIVGDDAIVGAELDLHAHLTDEMVKFSNAIVVYKEYPHTDIVDRARDLYRLCTQAAAGLTSPTSAVHDCRANGLFPTTQEPLRGFVDAMYAREGGDVLSLSLVHGFPYGDVAGAGVKMLAITDGDEALAQRIAREFGERFTAIRDDAALKAMSYEDAIDTALRENGTTVIADVADNAGGGAPGDSTFLLHCLLAQNAAAAVTGTYYDPIAVDLCFEAGTGATFSLRIGGKLGPASGAPVDLDVTVRALDEHHVQDAMDDSGHVPFGRSAWVHARGIDLVLVSIRSQVFAPNAFTNLGIDLKTAKIIVVKSTHHFYGKFAPLATRVIHASSPGALRTDFEAIPYTKRDLDYWPRTRTSPDAALKRAAQ